MNDERVSNTYRSVATERTPEHLDKAVLAEAARAVTPQYSRLTAWSRPLAWAATIALSVAVVLELTRAPLPDTVPAAPEAARLETEQAPAAEMKVEPEATVDQVENLSDAPLREDAQAAPQQAPTAAEAAGARRERAFEADAFAADDKDMRQQAEEFVQLRAGTVSADAALGRSASVASGAAAPGCDDAVTADPDAWLACIEDLEAAGFADEAARQRDLLDEQYPDYRSD